MGDGGGGEADAGAEFEDVDGSEDFVQDVYLAAGGVEAGGCDGEEGGFAGAVGAEDDPALVFFDCPVDVAEDVLAVAGDVCVVQV